MWLRLLVLVLYIFVIIIIIQQFDDVNALHAVANIHPIFVKFVLNTLWWIILFKFENQLICISKMAAMG